MFERKDNKNEKNLIIKLTILVIITAICTLISMLFEHIQMTESNIVMIYLLGILLFSYLAEGYLFSFFASVCTVLVYNFFFTEPFYNLKVNNPDYLFTFFVMFIVGFATSMLTIRVTKERQLVEDREVYISSLYDIERRLLNIKSVEELAKITAEEISRQLNANILVAFYHHHTGALLFKQIEGANVFEDSVDCSACLETYQSGSPCGLGTSLYSKAQAYYVPVFSQNGVLGVIGVALLDHTFLTTAQRAFMEVIAPQIAVVLERERVYEKQKQAQVEIQEERLRADLLRSVSHDLRTPLAGIMGLTSTALDNYEKLSDDVKKEFLQNIYGDADWLNELVENILQTTRFDEGRVKLNLGLEAAEEIITEAVSHVRKHALQHKIMVKIPDEIILLSLDGVLIRQVIVNIINNAVNYSPVESPILVTLYREESKVFFEVADQGTGISQEEIPHLFERFYHKSTKNSNIKRRGMGLGLALCKAIIEAHNGEIEITKNVPHGTIVKFYILSEKEKS